MNFRMTPVVSSALIAVFLAVTPSTAVAGGPGKGPRARTDRAIERASRDGAPGDTVQVIIQITDGSADPVSATLERRGHRLNRLGSIGSASTEVTVAELEELANTPGVTGISIDAPVQAHATVWGNQPPVTPDVLRAELGVKSTGPTGRGVGVALIDSGIAPIGDFDSRIRAFYDFTRGGKRVLPSDEFGHGTHVAGLIGGSGSQSRGVFAGVASDVTFIAMKVLDADGQGHTSSVIAAIQFAIANKTVLGIDVINLSLGHPIYEPAATDPLVQAVEQAVRAGIVVVTSAGNEGLDPLTGQPQYGGILSPGNAPSAITVGATKTSATAARGDDSVADYSSRGPTWFDAAAKPDVVAPGYRMVSDSVSTSTLYKENVSWRYATPYGMSGVYLRLSGSSMSTGIVTGVVALVLEANRSATSPGGRPMTALTPFDVKAILEYTATNVAGAEVLAQGAGEVNAAGALRLVDAFDTRWSPWAVEAVTMTTSIGGQTQPWSRTIVWGNTPVSGTPDDVVWLTHSVFAKGVAWGGAVTVANARNVVWGNALVSANLRNIVWGNADLAANARNVVWGNARNVVWGNTCDTQEICY